MYPKGWWELYSTQFSDTSHSKFRPSFDIDIEICRRCGGRLRVIASIKEPAVIERILKHLGREAVPVDPAHPSRAPPRSDRLI